MRPNPKLRSKALEADELDKVHGALQAKGSACGADYHCLNCSRAWPMTGGIYCPTCLKSTGGWY